MLFAVIVPEMMGGEDEVFMAGVGGGEVCAGR